MLARTRINRFKQDLLNVLSGNIIAQGTGYLSIVMISRNLGPEQYGIFSLLVAIFTLSVQLSDLGLSTPYVKYASQLNCSHKIRGLFFSVMAVRILISLLTAASIYYLSEELSLFLFETYTYSREIRIIAFSLAFQAIFKQLITQYQAMQKFKGYALLSIYNQLLKLAAVILFVYLFSNHAIITLLTVAFSFSVIPVLFLQSLTKFNPRKSFSLRIAPVKRIFKMGIWIFLSSVAVLLMMQLDMFMLQKLSTPEEVGYYSAANQLAMVFPILSMSIMTTILPKLGSYIKKHSIRHYVVTVLKKSPIVFLLMILLVALSPLMINFIYGASFESSISVFRILIISFLIGVIVNPIALVLYELNKAYILTCMNWLQLGLNYSANLYFIPSYQAEGAALATSLVRVLGGIIVIFFLFCGKNSVQKNN